MPEEPETLFHRIGGTAAVNGMVDEFYTRVLSDPELRPFFSETSVEKLKSMQAEFFAAALDGPMSAGDRDLTKAHQGRGITRTHVTKFVDHLISVLDERHAITRRDAMDIVFRVATYSDQVIGESGGADG